jgi:hypothetical protein
MALNNNKKPEKTGQISLKSSFGKTLNKSINTRSAW